MNDKEITLKQLKIKHSILKIQADVSIVKGESRDLVQMALENVDSIQAVIGMFMSLEEYLVYMKEYAFDDSSICRTMEELEALNKETARMIGTPTLYLVK